MNHVYLILVHNNPKQLYRLINKLRCANTLFLVHIDASAKLNDFLIPEEVWGDEVVFLEKRFRTKWGSFELVEATLTGLRFIIEEFPKTDRVTLLSGHDYPIKPLKQINSYLQANKDSIFINHFSIPARHWTNGGVGRFSNYERVSKIMKLYGGSQWWSFPMYAVELIFSIINDYPHILEYFRLAGIPDESFFQTILLNSDEEIITKNIVNESLKLVCWDVPYNSPRVFTETDLSLLGKSKKLFARKFDASVDACILNSIDDNFLDYTSHRKWRKEIKKNSIPQRQVVALLTNNISRISRYEKLKKELPEEFTSYLFFHKNADVDNDRLNTDNIFSFDDSILTSLGYKSIEKTILPGSNHFPLLAFYKNNPDYEYYWMVEDDVYYNGNWKNFFQKFSADESKVDFISCCLRSRREDPTWNWWNSLKENGFETNMATQITSFNPIYRLSNRALKLLCDKLSEGWSGHHEVLIPTLLFNAGFTILDFGGEGNFCFPQKQGAFYTSFMSSDFNLTRAGSVRFRPEISVAEIKDELLYHPVKIDDIEIIKTQQKGSKKITNKCYNEAILFLTNKVSEKIQEEFNELQRAANSRSTVKMLFHNEDNTNHTFQYQSQLPFIFDNSILDDLGYIPMNGELLPTNIHFPILKFYLENPEFDFYWLIEDDVRFNGRWKSFFKFFRKIKCSFDFLSSHIKGHHEAPDWHWWNSLSHPINLIDKNDMIASFNPIFRISSKALAYLHEQLFAKWQGHHEVLIPTLLNEGGFSIADFGGTGTFVPKGWQNKFYRPSFTDWHCKTFMNSMRYRPNIEKSEMNKSQLYHPVKS